MQPVSRPDRYPKLLAGAPSGHYASSTMSRVVLIHWNTAEGNERAATLRKAGHTAAFWFRQRKATRAVPIVFAGGLIDYKICAIDDTWSGLRFARRAVKR